MSKVLYGIDRRELWLPLLKDKRICVLTHAPAVDMEYRRSADVLCEYLNVTALCGPEHGLDGLAGAGESVDSSIDPETGVPVYSLYSSSGSSLADALKNADAAVCDFCDIGCRFFTYIWSMYDAMKVCSEKGTPVYVLDRPNPIGGTRCEGTVLEERFSSFVGRVPVPARHGLTLGEAAVMFKERFFPKCDLTVIPVSNWNRAMEFEDTGRIWVNPSPNMPGPDCARIFAGTCFMEGTNISEGRGTTRPFEMIGAPFIDPVKLAGWMNGYRIPGIRARACRFMPLSGKYTNEVCSGIQIIVEDRKTASCFEAGIRLLEVLQKETDGFAFKENGAFFDNLMGTDRFRLGTVTADEFLEQAREESFEFRRSVRSFLLYKD